MGARRAHSRIERCDPDPSSRPTTPRGGQATMKISRRRKRGRLRWTVDYEDSAGERVQKVFPTREAAEEYAAKATLRALTKTASTVPRETTYREFSKRLIEERKA